MCNFVSGFVIGTENGLAIVPTDNLCEHSENGYLRALKPKGQVFEFEWTSDDPADLSVRMKDDKKDNRPREWLLSSYPSRKAVVEALLGMLEYQISGDVLLAGEKTLFEWLSRVKIGGSLGRRVSRPERHGDHGPA